MSGHSKWATIKRHKAAQDAKRGKSFSLLSKEITIAARMGGRDTQFNSRLRTVISKAKAANMPADNIERAIQKGTGELPGQLIEELTYEGYAQCGVAIIVELTTDNKNRSATQVRTLFTKAGGSLASPGALSFTFKRAGQFLIQKDKISEDQLFEIALDAGAQDIKVEEDHYEVLCPVADFDKLNSTLESQNISTESAELSYIPLSTIHVDDPETEKKILKLIEALEELEDVKNVFSNLELSSF